MSAVLGASVGTSGVRGVLRETGPDPSEFLVDAGPASDSLDHVLGAVRALGREHEASSTVLAVRRDAEADAYGQETSDGVVLAVELGAQIRALYETRVLADEQTVALVDLGASGVSISVVDVPSGRVLLSQRTDSLGGDRSDGLLADFLTRTFGDPAQLTDEVGYQLVTDMRGIKEHLSVEPSVTLTGPFVGGRVTLWRTNLDNVVRADVDHVVDTAIWTMENAGARVDALVAVGGGANMQIVRRSLFEAVAIPVFIPYEPHLLAARGAASIAADLAPAEPDPVIPVPPPALPRHSDSSQKQSARRLRGRYLGGLVAVVVAGGVASAVVAAGTFDAGVTPSEVRSTVDPTGVSSPAPPVAMTTSSLPPSAASSDTTAPTSSTTQAAVTTVPRTSAASTTSVEPSTRTRATTTAAPEPTTSEKPEPSTTRAPDTTAAPPVATTPSRVATSTSAARTTTR